MATSTIDYTKILLVDNWPGVPATLADVPTDGFTGADHHNVTTAAFPVGTKMQVVCDGTVGTTGTATLIYLKFATEDATALAAKSVVAQDSATNWCEVTNDPSEAIAIPTGLAAVAISAMDADSYGWFWCGGVCPKQYVAAMTGDFATDDNLAAGPFTAHELTSGVIGLGPMNVEGTSATVQAETLFGYALAADA